MLNSNSRRSHATMVSDRYHSEEHQSHGHHWKKPAALAVSLAMTIGGLLIGQSFVAPETQAVIGSQPRIGVYPFHPATTDWWPTGNRYTSPVPIDNQTLYYTNSAGTLGYFNQRDGNPLTSMANTAITSLTSGGTTALPTTGGDWATTLAVDADPDGTRGGAVAYLWDWDHNSAGYTMATGAGYTNPQTTASGGLPAITSSNSDVVFRVKDGGTAMSYALMPDPVWFDPTTNGAGNGWSGGEVIQQTGQIFFSGREDEGLGSEYTMMIYDPTTYEYNYSGQIMPATPGDNIFGTSDSTTLGYVSSDMALDADGNAYILVLSNQAAPAFGLASGTYRTWLVKVTPSWDVSKPWTYQLITPVVGGPGSAGNAAGNNTSTDMWGLAFYQGLLYYQYSSNYVVEVNPMSGYRYNVGRSTANTAISNGSVRDLASGQTAIVLQGTVYNDVDADGSVTGDPGLAGQQVALYQRVEDNYVYQGVRTTNDSGNYSFLLGGFGDYIVRLVQPGIGGVNAIQTFANGGGDTNVVTAHCAGGNITSANGGICIGALAMPTSDPALPTAATAAGNDTSTQPNQMAMYSSVAVTSDRDVANANFGVTVSGSYGDAAAGPATIAANAPMHINGAQPQLWLGAKPGVWPGPATDNAAHNSTDDGVYIDSYTGKLPLTNTVLAGTKSYNLAADVSGPLASSAQVGAWTATGTGTWSATQTWQAPVSSGKATGPYQYATTGTFGASGTNVQMRVNVSTTTPSGPTNAGGSYQSATALTTAGEIEDYSFRVADAVYRPAAKTSGGTGDFNVAGASITAGPDAVVAPAVGAAAGQALTLTASTPATWTVSGITIKDTENGTVLSQPAFDLNSTGASFSYTPTSGSDVIIEVSYARDPDTTKSTLTLDPVSGSVQVGSSIRAIATVKDVDGIPLNDVVVSFAKKSADVTLSDTTCTTVNGTCFVTVTSNVAKTYTGEISATVKVAAQDQGISGSPATVTFTPGGFSYDKSTFSVAPAVSTTDKSNWQIANGTSAYTGTLTAEDGDGNPLVSLSSSDIAFSASSTDVTVSSVTNHNDGTYTVSFTTKKASDAYTASVKYQSTAVGSAKPIPFKAGEPALDPVCPDPARPGTNLSVSPASLPVGSTSAATALITDADCNPVQDSTVTFSIDTGTSALLTVVQATTDSTGKAYANVNDTVAESVIVHARITEGEIHGSPATVTFTTGGFSWINSTFTVTPAANLTDRTTWQTVTVRSYTGTLTAEDNNHNKLSNLTVSDIAFSASSSNVTVSSVTNHNDGTGTYTVTYTAHIASDAYTASVMYQNSPVGTALPIPFKAGIPDVNPICPDPARPGTNLSVTPTSLQVGGTSTVTGYITDSDCNPVPDTMVTFSTEKSASLSQTSKATGSDGKAIVTLTDTVAESVVVRAAIMAGQLPGSPTTVRFTEGGFSWTTSSFAVTPVADTTNNATWQISDGQSAYVGTLTAKDANLNPLSSLSTSDMTFSVSSPDVTVSSVTNSGGGNYTVSFTSRVASPSYTASVTYLGSPVGTAAPIPFKAGPPALNPNCPDPARPGTNLSVSPTSVQVSNRSTVTAYITDDNCNPVQGSLVTFSTEKSASMSAPTMQTQANGTAIVYVTDTTAESVNVHATILSNGEQRDINRSPQQVTFTIGGFSQTYSTFTVTPVANTSDRTTWQTVVTGSYTGTLTAKDDFQNAMSSLSTSDMVFTPSSADVSVTSVTNNNNGTYTVQFTARKASDAYTASVTYKGDPVGTAQPIPFKAGEPNPNPVCTDPARPGSSLTVNPPTVQINTSSTVTAFVTDSECNPVPGAQVTFATEKSATITPLTLATGSDGKAIATVRDAEVESVAVHASITQGELAGSPKTVNFIDSNFSWLNSTFTVTPVANTSDKTTWQTANGDSAYVGTMTAKDGSDVPQTNLNLADIVFTPSSPDVTMSSVTNQGNGRYTVNFTTTKASDAYTASVAYLGTKVGADQPIPFKAGPPDPNPICTDPARPGSNLSVSPATVQVGDTSTAIALVTDSDCNPVQGTEVTFSVDQSASIAPLTMQTGANGIATASVTDTVAESVQVHATILYDEEQRDLTNSPATVRFTTDIIDNLMSSFAVTPQADLADRTTWVLANGTSAYTGTLTARDSYGNLLPDLSAEDIADFSFTASAPTVTVSTVTNTGNGTYSVLYTSLVASADTTASLTYQGEPVGTAQPIPFKAGTPVVIECTDPATGITRQGTTLTVNPSTVAIPGTSTATALVTDENCNPTPDVTVTFSADKSAAVSAPTIQTDNNGRAVVQVSDLVAETVNVHATILMDEEQRDVGYSPAQVTFTAGDFSWIDSSFSVTPVANTANRATWVTADGASAYTGMLTAKDENGNLKSNLSVSDMDFSASSPDVAVSSVTNNHNGTYSVTFTSRVASPDDTASLTYQDNPVGTEKPIPFVAGPPEPNPICTDPARPGTNLSVSPASVGVGGQSTVTAYVTDRDCNPVQDAMVTFSTEKSASIAPLALATGPDGNAIAHVTDTVAESVDVHASIPEGELAESPQTVTFTAGGFSWVDSTFTVTPVADLADETTWVTANGTSTYRGILTAKDNNGNILPDLATKDIAFFVSSDDVTISPIADYNNGTYVVTYTTKVASPDYTASATYLGDQVGTDMPIPFAAGTPVINPDCPDPARPGTNLSVSPTTLQVGGTSTATALVTDADCNPVHNAMVTFSTEKSASVSPLTKVTGANGIATAAVTDRTAESVAVHATIVQGELTGSPATVTFTAGGFSSVQSTFAVVPQANLSDRTTWVTADGTSAYTGVLTGKDDNGNLLPDLTVEDMVFTASSTDVAVTDVVNNNDGTYSVAFTSTVASPAYTASATYLGSQVGTDEPIPFKAGAPVVNPVCDDPARPGTNLSVAPASLPVGDQATATALVTDASCNPVQDVVVTFSLGDGSHALANTVQATTDPSGKAYSQIVDTVAEQVAVHAAITQGELNGSPATVTFTAGGFSWLASSFTVSPVANLANRATWVPADGVSSYTGTLTAKDSNGNLVTTLSVADLVFAPSSTDVTVSSVTDNHNGTYQVSLSSRVASPAYTAAVTYQGSPVGAAKPIPFKAGEPVINPVCDDPARPGTNLSVSPSTLPVGTEATATALVTDASCNPVQDVTVTFSTDKSASIAPVTVVTGEDGKAIAKVSDNVAETANVHASITQGELNGSPAAVIFTAGGPDINPVCTDPARPGTNLSVSPTSLPAGSEATATALVTDSLCNPVPNTTVTFAVDKSGSIAPVTVTTGPDGKAVAKLTDLVAETVSVTATITQGELPGSPASVTFVAGPPVLNPNCPDPQRPGTNLTAGPSTVVIPNTAVAIAYITDANCNPVQPGVHVAFSVDGKATVSAADAVTDESGKAIVTVADATAETVKVRALIPQLDNGEVPGSPATVTFVDLSPKITTGGTSVPATPLRGLAAGLILAVAGLWVGVKRRSA